MPLLSKKRRYAKSAMSLVGGDISTGFKTLKAATVIIIEGAVLEYAVKKYKSHRRLSRSINLFTIEEDYWEKRKTQMTFKRCK